MTDFVPPQKRSQIMSLIHAKNTKPEKIVRSWLHKKGFRFRIHRKDLLGCPDIVLPKYKTIIFVHGCFWHHHQNCKFAYIPQSNQAFWLTKFEKNRKRDTHTKEKLEELGWKVFVIWECELSNLDQACERIIKMLPRK